jgi:hypothetical protein
MCEAETRSVSAETGKAAQPPQVMTARESNLASLQRWYETYQLVYEFRGGLVKRLAAHGSHDEALGAAREAQRA